MMVQTEIGLLPEDWEVVQIGDIFSMPSNSIRTQNINPSEYVSTENLLPNKAGVSKYTSRIDYAFVREYKAGDSLMSNIRPYLKKIWFSDRSGGCSSDVIVFRPSKDVDSQYAYFVLSDDRIFRLAMETSIGTKMPRGDKNAIVAFPIALPKDKTEQQNIATALSSIDKLIDDLGCTIQKKQRIREGAMEELLSGKKRLPGFTEEWVEKRIGDINYIRIYQPQTISQEVLADVGYPVFGANGIIGYYHKYNHETDQVMVTCRGSSCGTINYSIGKCWITGNAMVLNIDHCTELNKKFLYYLLCDRDLTPLITGSGQPQIVRGPLSDYIIFFPSDIREQHAIADILTSMDDEISLLESERAKYEQIRSGMMEELLTGKKRLIKK